MSREAINKKLGKKIIIQGDEEIVVPVMETGFPLLDSIIGGGLPKGKVAEIYGLQGTGKTTLAIQISAKAQKKGLKVAWADLENAWDRKYAEALGINSKELVMIKADYGEEAFEAIEMLITEGEANLVVVDSIPAIAPRSELEAEVGKPTMGSQARLIAQAFRKLIPALEKSGAILIFINQLRINIMGGQYDPYVRPGGQALKFYERTAIQLKKRSALKKGDVIVGNNIQVKAVKSYSTAPFQMTDMQLIFGDGFSLEADLLASAIEKEIIEKKKNTYYFGETNLGVGKEKARTFLKVNPLILEKIKLEL